VKCPAVNNVPGYLLVEQPETKATTGSPLMTHCTGASHTSAMKPEISRATIVLAYTERASQPIINYI